MSVFRRGIIPKEIPPSLQQYLTEQDMNLNECLNKGLSFPENFDGVSLTFASNAVADTEDAVAHELGKVPTGFLVMALNKGAVLYSGGTADTEAVIHLKSTVASTTFTIFIF